MSEPSWRKPAGVLLILILIGLWTGLIVGLSDAIAPLPALAQAPIYLFLGIIWLWLFPFRRLLRWMETGKWRD